MIEIPYSPNHGANRDRCGDDYPCVVCGKAVKSARRKMVRMWWGTVLVTEAEALTLESAGDMGYYPIGSGCLLRHPELKPYVAKNEGN